MEFDSLVAAGGYGTRYGAGCPKSLLDAGEIPFVALSVAGLLDAGHQNILVTTNRREWMSALSEVFRGWPGVFVTEDRGYASTFQLVQNYVPKMKKQA